MKKIYTTVLLFSILFTVSCSKDVLKSYEKRIVGTWQITDIDRSGFGGNTDNMPFKDGQFVFNDDGTLTYTNPAGANYQGTWNIEKKYYDETTYRSLQLTAINFSNQQVLGEYYDDIEFISTDHFKTRIYQGLHTYITHFRR